MRRNTWRRAVIATLFALVPACKTAGSRMTPKQIDQISGQCRQKFAPGTVAVRDIRSRNIGHREERAPAGTPVLLYGASWCEACDIAASYMTRRGIPFVERDIEEDPEAEAALTSTLRLAGLDTDVVALPVIDVRGTVMRGFYPCVVEVAWKD
jgi:glutaredoxin